MAHQLPGPPVVTSTIIGEKVTHAVELAVTDSPALKVDHLHYDVTGLRVTYEDDQVTRLTVLGVDRGTGKAEEIGTRLDQYELVQPRIRYEVEKHRPSRRLSAYRATVLHEAADILDKSIPEGASSEDWEELIGWIEEIREAAQEAERAADPGWDPKGFLKSFIDIEP
ncbi:hypothetical protein [Streptomyces sp. 5-10]|uniref:hypothetical protein n=1 Tax=Streptomyces sp. 5-10 TaxID=878925 RepID=UPI00168AE22F|nr:hypothetical protein [Streptomyces sp. 5-10]MBD3004673.1 hypothetical protein [Streptomyces sp. 5-10]